MKSFKKISGLIKNELSSCHDAPVSQNVQNQLRESWRNHAGDSIMHTFPLLFQSGRLVIYCDSSVWSTSLRHQQTSLISKLSTDGIAVKEIKIKVHPISIPTTEKTKEAALLSASTSNQIRSTANRLSHPGLKKSLLKLSKRQVKVD
ncbi:MAG: DUF721 domain-containing protein [Gammaproteobacteria bacterium]|nr:DUF721 domain-containing protein [Gammaproteobacteria bacterium]